MAKGEDPDDWDVVLQDVHQDLKEAMEMCRQVAEEQGVDLEGLDIQEEVEEEKEEEEEPQVDISKHPFRERAHKCAMEIHKFLDKLASLIQEDRVKGKEPVVLQECFEVISWYHMQMAVKIDRSLRGRGRDEETDEVLEEARLSDSDGSAKVAFLGMTRMVDSLTRVYECHQGLERDVMPLLDSLYELIEELNSEFPGHKSFRRPGFDE